MFDGLTRDDFRKSFDKMVGLVGRLHEAGVRIVAGTDGYGLELVRELELYQQAGLSNAEALQTATIVPGADDRHGRPTGSIAVGKTPTSSWSTATCRRTSATSAMSTPSSSTATG